MSIRGFLLFLSRLEFVLGPKQTCGLGGNDYLSPGMNSTNAPLTPPPGGAPTGIPVAKRRPWLFYGCGILIALVVVVCATVALTIWYIQRPIKPVELSASEKAEVETKLDRLGGSAGQSRRGSVGQGAATQSEPDRKYEPGSKVLRLTERELNGLLNANTDLGKTVRIELGRDAINAYVTAPIPQDVPVLGGKMFRARARFSVALVSGAAPSAILEDVTVFGLSLPKGWLGGMKGENLLGDAVGARNGTPILSGIKSFRIEPGALVLEVAD